MNNIAPEKRCRFCNQQKNECCIWSIYWNEYHNEEWDTLVFKNFVKNYPYYKDYKYKDSLSLKR